MDCGHAPRSRRVCGCHGMGLPRDAEDAIARPSVDLWEAQTSLVKNDCSEKST